MKAAEMEQSRKVGTRLRSSLWNGSRHIWLPVMCNVYRVTLIPNGVKKRGDKTGACCLSGEHQSRLKRKCELLMHHIDPVALPNLSAWHQLLSQEPCCCKKKCISWYRLGLSGKVAFMDGESERDVTVLQQVSQFSPSMNLCCCTTSQ